MQIAGWNRKIDLKIFNREQGVHKFLWTFRPGNRFSTRRPSFLEEQYFTDFRVP